MNPTGRIETALDDWGREAGLSLESKRKYSGTLRAVVAFGLSNLEDLTVEKVRTFISDRLAIGLSASRCAQHLSEIRSFVSWLEGRGRLPVGRATALKAAAMA